MTTIGFIGSGNIGGTVAGLAIAAGPRRGAQQFPRTGDPDRPGRGARARTPPPPPPPTPPSEGDIVVVSIPAAGLPGCPGRAAGRARSSSTPTTTTGSGTGTSPSSTTSSTTSAGLLQAHLPQSRVVKAFNHIRSTELPRTVQPAGTPDRRALVIAGDDAEAKAVVTDLLDSFGYDVVDAGSAAEGWRFEPDHPAYGPTVDRRTR